MRNPDKPDIDEIYRILREWAATGPKYYGDLSRQYKMRTGEWFEPHGSWDEPLGELNRRLGVRPRIETR